MYIFRRDTNPEYLKLSVLNEKDFIWFTPINDGDFYGEYLGTYKLKRDISLLKLGSMVVRKQIIKSHPELKGPLEPDFQYSGHASNRHVHELLFKIYGSKFDGTGIISDEVDDEELEGPTEFVIWGDLTEILEEISITTNHRN